MTMSEHAQCCAYALAGDSEGIAVIAMTSDAEGVVIY
jgi:hypothetical protein